MRVETETGSIYFLDREAMTWSREQKPSYESPFPLRTKGGFMNEWPNVEIGKSLVLIGPPITQGMTGRLIETSPVVKILEE